ncbi:uncharacterized protein [Anolis sagrei]|uniref:uncharacterized protein n=1 Tax=Anolis sagrei TaxID=38937 RepID=UPI003522B0B3
MYGQPSSGWSPPPHYPQQERKDEPWTLEEERQRMPAGKEMTEMMGGYEGPHGPLEVCATCQIPASNPNSDAREEGGSNVDQEMQWVSTRMESPLHALPLNIQPFPTPAQGQSQGPYPFGSPSLGLCEEFPSEEMPTVPAESACEDMCVRDSAERHCGLPYESQQCENTCKMLPERHLYENQYGEPWPGKARLPSIVVEPSEREEVESGELRWPPENFLFLDEEEQNELFNREEESLETGLSSFDSDVEEVLL